MAPRMRERLAAANQTGGLSRGALLVGEERTECSAAAAARDGRLLGAAARALAGGDVASSTFNRPVTGDPQAHSDEMSDASVNVAAARKFGGEKNG